MNRRSLTRLLATYPPMSLRVLSGIYRQAAITWLRGARFHSRPAPDGVVPARDTVREPSAA